MGQLASLIRGFAALLVSDDGPRLKQWISTAQRANLPQFHSFVRGLQLDHDDVHAAVTSEYHNGGTEGATSRPK